MLGGCQIKQLSHANDDDMSRQAAALQDGGRSIGKIIAGDETWVHCYQPDSKQASKQRKYKETIS